MSQASALSAEEVRALQQELADGGTPTVWFTSAAVGVQEGKSGKVIALDEPAEGDFIQVRPAGSKDVLSFSVAEVTVVKPPRKRKEPDTRSTKRDTSSKETGGGTRARRSEGDTQRGSDARQPAAATPPAATQPAATTRAPSTTRTSAAGTSGTETRSSGGGDSAPSTAKRKPKQLSPATVTLTADQSGQWSVEVSTGKKRLLRPRTVPASAVAQAAKALHEDVASAVEPLIEAARAEQHARIERLQQELAEAQRMLDDLG